MALSNTERSRNHRARKAQESAALSLAADPVPDSEPGPVLAAVEASIASIRNPDPVLAALARREAAHLDASGALNHQVAAELRRTMNDLRGRKPAGAAGSGLSGGRQRVNKVSELRRDYQSARSKRAAS